jgi:hypothetical protein
MKIIPEPAEPSDLKGMPSLSERECRQWQGMGLLFHQQETMAKATSQNVAEF